MKTARWCGSWADGLITVHQPLDKLRELIGAFREGGGVGKPVAVQAKVSWAPTDDEALAIAHEQWRTNVFPSVVMADLEQVAQFEAAGAFVRPEDMHGSVLISSDLGRFRGWLQALLDLDIENLIVHHMGKDQRPFIDAFGADVLPSLDR